MEGLAFALSVLALHQHEWWISVGLGVIAVVATLVALVAGVVALLRWRRERNTIQISGSNPLNDFGIGTEMRKMRKVLTWIAIVLAGLAVVVVIAVPYVFPRYTHHDPSNARIAEFWNVYTAVTAMMVDNDIASIPNVISAASPGCTTGSNKMDAWPDSTSVARSEDKETDPNGGTYQAADKAGYVLFGHDFTADNNATPLVNYLLFNKSRFCYTIESNGIVHQYDPDGTEYPQLRQG